MCSGWDCAVTLQETEVRAGEDSAGHSHQRTRGLSVVSAATTLDDSIRPEPPQFATIVSQDILSHWRGEVRFSNLSLTGGPQAAVFGRLETEDEPGRASRRLSEEVETKWGDTTRSTRLLAPLASINNLEFPSRSLQMLSITLGSLDTVLSTSSVIRMMRVVDALTARPAAPQGKTATGTAATATNEGSEPSPHRRSVNGNEVAGAEGEADGKVDANMAAVTADSEAAPQSFSAPIIALRNALLSSRIVLTSEKLRVVAVHQSGLQGMVSRYLALLHEGRC